MRRILLVLVVLVPLGVTAVADAAVIAVRQVKKCYRSGETPTVIGAGFTPSRAVSITSDGDGIGSLATTTQGVFAGTLTIGLERGERVRTYAAVDEVVPTVTASIKLRISAVTVRVAPLSGTPGQRVRVRARGFTTGKRLWAHIRGHIDRDVKVGRLRHKCHKLRRRRRIVPADAPDGRYIVQFDTRRRYKRSRKVKVRFSVTVYPVFGARLSSGQTWKLLPG